MKSQAATRRRLRGFPGTLRGQLAAGYIIVLAGVLLLLSSFEYGALGVFLVRHTADSLTTEIRAAAQSANLRPGVFTSAQAARLASTLSSPNRMVWVYDGYLNELARGGRALAPDPASKRPPFAVLAALSDGRQHPPMVWTHDGTRWLVVTQRFAPAFIPGAPAVIVAESFRDGSIIIARFAVLSLLGGGLALILAVLVGLGLVGRSLRPLARVAEVSERITAGRYGQRVDLNGSTAEVRQVGQALNTMLDSVEAALDAERLSQQRIRRFVADAAHELRTPVTAINGFLEVLQRQRSHDPETLARSLNVMESEGQRLARMVNQLLDLARLDQQTELALSQVEVNELLSTIQPALDVLAGDHPLQLDQAPEPLRIRANPDALKQVLWNLIDNAARYSPAGLPIEIYTGRDDDEVVLSVLDRGPGISTEDLPHVFERFYRSNQVHTQPGTGLGLAIVKSLLDVHQAKIALLPRAGGGTEARISFLGYKGPMSA